MSKVAEALFDIRAFLAKLAFWGTLVAASLKVIGVVTVPWIKTLVPIALFVLINFALYIITSATVALLTVLVGIFATYDEYKTRKANGNGTY